VGPRSLLRFFFAGAVSLLPSVVSATETEPASPPSVELQIYAPSAHGTWRMRVVNTGNVPVRLTADPRLLVFDLYVPDVRAPLRCSLPADMRTTNDVDRALVLPPRRSYSEYIDPRLYCFGARETAALAPGTTVVAHLGWPAPLPPPGAAAHRPAPPPPAARGARAGRPPAPPPPPRPPFEVSSLDGVVPPVLPVKELVATAFTLPADPPRPAPPANAAAQAAAEASQDPFPPHLSVSIPAHLESWSPFELSVPVTVKNEGNRPVTFLFRTETIGFDVIGPNGSERCTYATGPGAPIREMYTTLGPGGRATRSVLLESICTGNSLDQGGLLIIRPRLDTRGSSGAQIGVRTFDGEVLGQSTLVLRLHRGRRPERVERPRLDPP
jgi:hypothetical protein